jgi:hypothetical protein
MQKVIVCIFRCYPFVRGIDKESGVCEMRKQRLEDNNLEDGGFPCDFTGRSAAGAAGMSVSGASRDPRLVAQGATSAFEAQSPVTVAVNVSCSESAPSSAKRAFDADHGTPAEKRLRLDPEAKAREYAGKYQLEHDARKDLETRHSKLKGVFCKLTGVFYAKKDENTMLEERVTVLESEVEIRGRGNTKLKKEIAQSQCSFSNERKAMSLKMKAVEEELRKSNAEVKQQSAIVDDLMRRQKQYEGYLLEIKGRRFTIAEPQKPKMPEEESWMICPISQEVMKEPVSIETGQAYEKDTIEAWFADNTTCPITGLEVERRDNLMVSIALREAIQSSQRDPMVKAKCLLYQEQKKQYEIGLTQYQALKQQDDVRKRDAQKQLESLGLSLSNDQGLGSGLFSLQEKREVDQAGPAEHPQGSAK